MENFYTKFKRVGPNFQPLNLIIQVRSINVQIPFCVLHILIYSTTMLSQDLLQTFQMSAKKKKFHNEHMIALYHTSKITIYTGKWIH